MLGRTSHGRPLSPFRAEPMGVCEAERRERKGELRFGEKRCGGREGAKRAKRRAGKWSLLRPHCCASWERGGRLRSLFSFCNGAWVLENARSLGIHGEQWNSEASQNSPHLYTEVIPLVVWDSFQVHFRFIYARILGMWTSLVHFDTIPLVRFISMPPH